MIALINLFVLVVGGFIIFKRLNKITMSQDELVAKLTGLTAKVEKVSTEIVALKEALSASGEISPEVQAALDSLDAAITGADDLNEDAEIEE